MMAMRDPAQARFLPVVLALVLAGTAPAQEMPLPPKPAGHLLDQAEVFTPEQRARISAALTKASREDGVEVYVLTLHAVPKGQLQYLGADVTRAWTANAVGGTLVFEDQFGNVSVGTSDEADRRFTTLVINMVMREPLMMGRKKGISPEKLEHAAYSVVASLKSLVDKERNERHGKWITNTVMAIVVIVAGTVIGMVSWSRRKREVAEAEAPTGEKIPDSTA
jgi:hypothetical protein